MKKAKKTSLLFVLIMVLLFAFQVHAEEMIEPEHIEPTGLDTPPEDQLDLEYNPENEISPHADHDETELFFILEDRIKNAILSGETSISISDLRINKTAFSVNMLEYFSPYFSNGIDLGFWYSSDIYTKIEIQNKMSLDETRNYFLNIDGKMNEILQQVTDDMSAETKALIIHDYLVYEYEYDYDNLLSGTLPADSYKSGGLIMNGTGVCQAYAYAYKYIMNSLGIECYVTSSDAMNHAWNIINIDGSYYHVDCTWDDPVYDRMGLVGHGYFLVSDQSIQTPRGGGQNTHYDWNLTNLVCDNTKYDDAYWQNISSQIIIYGNSSYYISDSCIYSRDLTNGTIRELKNLGIWNVWGKPSFWQGAFSGLFLQDCELYYNTSREIKKISLDGQRDVTVCQPDTSNGYIYGSRKHQGELQYVIKQDPSTNGEKFSMPIPFEIKPTGILLDSTELQLSANSSKKLTYVFIPGDALASVTWISDSPQIASVSDGVVTGVAPGSAVITATTDNGISASCQVTVLDKKTCKVTYDANGGKVTTTSQTVYLDSAYGTLPTPSRNGYKFAGWYTSSSGGSVVTSSSVVSNKNDHTLYAHWTLTNYTVTYHLNGGKNSSGNPTSYNVNTNTIILKNPSKTGYTFSGWYSDSSFKNKVTQILKGSTGNRSLYAKWTLTNYKITYNLYGGKNTSSNPATYNVNTNTITLRSPTKTGYTFNGWYTTSSYKTKVTQIPKGSTGNKTFYAKWTLTNYKITYNLNGGKNASGNPATYNKNTNTITLKSPAKTGYTFNGWYTTSSYKTKVTQISKGSTGNKTFYAKWTANTYKIRYNRNGGSSGSMADTTCKYGSTYKLRANTFKRTGYKFAGWATSPSGKVVYKDNASIKNLLSTKGGTKTLYAKWTANTYKITYNLNRGKNNSKNPSTYKITSNTITLKNPTRTGYVFKGWYTSSSYKKKVTTIPKGSTGNRVLYAKWAKK